MFNCDIVCVPHYLLITYEGTLVVLLVTHVPHTQAAPSFTTLYVESKGALSNFLCAWSIVAIIMII